MKVYKVRKKCKTPYLRNRVNPDVNCVTGALHVGFIKLVSFRPPERHIAQPFLGDGMEPGKQEVQTRSFIRSLIIGSGCPAQQTNLLSKKECNIDSNL